MGEGRLTGDESSSNRRLTVPQVAQALGITEGAVRGRLKRGTLRSHRGAGTVYMVLEGDEERRRREEAEREHDNLRRELYALREPREPPETASEEPERAESRPATGEAQEGVRRPWWRRVLRG